MRQTKKQLKTNTKQQSSEIKFGVHLDNVCYKTNCKLNSMVIDVVSVEKDLLIFTRKRHAMYMLQP